jgi:DNA polymerase III subunit delta'
MIVLGKSSSPRLPWLDAAKQRVSSSLEQGRLPHALLIHAPQGVGAESLAAWIAQLALCTSPAMEPCGSCSSCRLFSANNHTDLHWVMRAEDAKQLQIDQIRELCETFALKSYRGGRKVGVIAPADLMTANAANALLKTLEEPPPEGLLILIAERPSRLPATIVSRCQRITVSVPPRKIALEWLTAADPSVGDWSELLEFAAGAPRRALELRASGFENLHQEMTAAVTALRERSLDIPATAERWWRDSIEARLAWIETWITKSLREALLGTANLQSLPGIRKIRALYGLLDRVREFKLELSTPLNVQLAAEELLLRAQATLTS